MHDEDLEDEGEADDDLTPLERTRQQLRSVRDRIRRAEQAEKGGWTAVSQLTRLEANLVERVLELEQAEQAAPGRGAYADLDDDQLFAVVLRTISKLPDHLVDRISDALEAVRSGQPVSTVLDRV